MDIIETTAFVALGFLLGVVGQGARVIVGLKKNYDRGTKDWFDARLLVTSLVIGGIAGAIGSIALFDKEIEKQTLFTIVATGYAGADFIEGFMRKSLPN